MLLTRGTDAEAAADVRLCISAVHLHTENAGLNCNINLAD